MKRFVLTTAAAIGMVCTAFAAAQVSQTVYEGSLDDVPGSSVRVKVLEEDGELFVTSFAARDFDVECEGGVTVPIARALGKGSVPVGAHGGFRFKDDTGKTVLKYAGEIGPPPAGKFRFFGKVDAGDDGTLECDSGRLFWTTKK